MDAPAHSPAPPRVEGEPLSYLPAVQMDGRTSWRNLGRRVLASRAHPQKSLFLTGTVFIIIA